LILSGNIGKYAARLSIARMLPPETILAYSDDDMYFYPDWLAPQIELLNYFPNVSCVTGNPVRTQFRWGNENTVKWAMTHAQVNTGRFIPQEWEDDFALSVGRTPEWHKEYTKNDTDLLITYKNKQAYATSHHCQHVSYAGTVAKIPLYDHLAMSRETPFDNEMDKLGLRLATTQRYCRHIGNILENELIGA